MEIGREREVDVNVSFREGEGYAVGVASSKGAERVKEEKASILTYHSTREAGLETFLEKVRKVCIRKQAGERLARVVAC